MEEGRKFLKILKNERGVRVHLISNGGREKERMSEATAVSQTFKTSLINSLEQNIIKLMGTVKLDLFYFYGK